MIVKSFGLKIAKDYKENSKDITGFIKTNLKKLEIKINYINLLLNNNIINKKINYSSDIINLNTIEKMEFVEFSQDLFITSEEFSNSEESMPNDSVNLVYSQHTPFIAEYSN
jgi:hypothetical protein